MALRALFTALLAASAAGCFSPALDCVFACGADGLCPGDLTCGGDGVCHTAGSTSCGAPAGADARADAHADGGADAAVPLPDAAPLLPDAALPLPDAPQPPPPDAATPEPDAPPPPEPDAPLPAPDAPLPPDAPPPPDAAPPPDAPPPPCQETFSNADDYDDDVAVILDTRLGFTRGGETHLTFISSIQGAISIQNARRGPEGGGFAIEPIGGALDYHLGQAIDDGGAVHVTYVGGSVHQLWYSRRAPAGGWVTTPATDMASFNSSIVVDPEGGRHVTFKYYFDLAHAYRGPNDSAWQIEPIDPSIGTAVQTSLGFLPSGALALAYRADGPGTSSLRYATRGAAGWVTRPLDESNLTGNYPAMAVHPSGAVQVVYGEYATGHLKLLSMPPAGGTSIVTADGAGGVGRYNSVALDEQERLHIVTVDYTDGLVKYELADPAQPGIQRRTLEMVGAVQSRTSLAWAPDGALWVAFPSAVHGHVRVGRICTSP